VGGWLTSLDGILEPPVVLLLLFLTNLVLLLLFGSLLDGQRHRVGTSRQTSIQAANLNLVVKSFHSTTSDW